nr:zinc finger protein 567-like [Halyomorpha halys]
MKNILQDMDSKELENDVLEALYPETQILENNEVWSEQRCHVCGETFPDKQTKQIHMRETHTGSFICSVCGKIFSQRSGLSHHLPMHSDVKSFHCNVCGKAFRQRSGLTHHKQTHSEVKSFSCEICGKLFAQRSGVIHHKSTHLAIKSFSCGVCGKSFAQRSGLAHHKNTHVKKMNLISNKTPTFNVMSGNNSVD